MEDIDQPILQIGPQQETSFYQTHTFIIKTAIGLICLIAAICLTAFALRTPKKQQNAYEAQHLTTENADAISSVPTTQPLTYDTTTLLQSGSIVDRTKLPLGDSKYTTTTPKKGYVYLCAVQTNTGGASTVGPWIQGSTWNLVTKPAVAGHISWPTATFSDTIANGNRIITGNALPLSVTTGTFPIQSSDPAYSYDTNPNTISAHQFTDTFPVSPTYSATPYCMGGEVGIMLNGVPLFDGFDAELRDAAAHEVQDTCQGHPQESGEYHYHSLSTCIPDIHETTVIGFALDGFPITGPELTTGKYLTTNDLDVCHGITSQILLDGKETMTYHYVMTEDFPYSMSCFRGKPISYHVITTTQAHSTGQNISPHQPSGTITNLQPSGQQGQHPPQQAFAACSGKSSGTTCSFATPNGNVSGTCGTPPNESTVVCMPTNQRSPQSNLQ